MTKREPTDHFLAEVRAAILSDSGSSGAESRHFLDGLDLRGYQLGAHLGTGAAGAVYGATDPQGHKVAIKVLPLPEGESAAKIFQREVKIGQTITVAGYPGRSSVSSVMGQTLTTPSGDVLTMRFFDLLKSGGPPSQ